MLDSFFEKVSAEYDVFIGAILLENYASKFHHDLNVIWQSFVRLPQMPDASLHVYLGPDDAPAKSEINLSEQA